MENTIIYLTLWASIATGLLAIAIFLIILQRRQLWQSEEHIQSLQNKQDIFPDPDIHIRLSNSIKSTSKPLDNGYLRRNV